MVQSSGIKPVGFLHAFRGSWHLITLITFLVIYYYLIRYIIKCSHYPVSALSSIYIIKKLGKKEASAYVFILKKFNTCYVSNSHKKLTAFGFEKNTRLARVILNRKLCERPYDQGNFPLIDRNVFIQIKFQ